MTNLQRGNKKRLYLNNINREEGSKAKISMNGIPAPDQYDAPMHINQKNPTKTNRGMGRTPG